MKRARKPAGHEPALVSELRSAIADAGVNNYAIAREAGVDEGSVRKFLSRARSLSLDSAGRLAAALGLRLVRPGKPRKFQGRPSPEPASDLARAKDGPDPGGDDDEGPG